MKKHSFLGLALLLSSSLFGCAVPKAPGTTLAASGNQAAVTEATAPVALAKGTSALRVGVKWPGRSLKKIPYGTFRVYLTLNDPISGDPIDQRNIDNPGVATESVVTFGLFPSSPLHPGRVDIHAKAMLDYSTTLAQATSSVELRPLEIANATISLVPEGVGLVPILDELVAKVGSEMATESVLNRNNVLVESTFVRGHGVLGSNPAIQDAGVAVNFEGMPTLGNVFTCVPEATASAIRFGIGINSPHPEVYWGSGQLMLVSYRAGHAQFTAVTDIVFYPTGSQVASFSVRPGPLTFDDPGIPEFPGVATGSL